MCSTRLFYFFFSLVVHVVLVLLLPILNNSVCRSGEFACVRFDDLRNFNDFLAFQSVLTGAN